MERFPFVWIQFPIDLETFFGMVSKSNGNVFYFINMFPNQLNICCHDEEVILGIKFTVVKAITMDKLTKVRATYFDLVRSIISDN